MNHSSKKLSPNQDDLPKLAVALEYADLSAALYLAGGSDHAARLLAAAAEEVLGELAKLLGGHARNNDAVQTLLARIALRYQAPLIDTRSQAANRQLQSTGPNGERDEVRAATATYLRAAWYILESMGLEAVIPQRLQKAVDQSTICR
ncbi:hypothetical protein [Roseateles sp. PN1]|uniref:hypothetical protein n=1 Tax=Roseateles sp. PN1 TaxID=3137372 RepID=UPI003138F7BD